MTCLFDFTPTYKSKMTGFESKLLHKVMGQESKLTIDCSSDTGLKEIERKPVSDFIPRCEHQLSKMTDEEIVDLLIEVLYEIILEHWDHDNHNYILSSGGLDSRIVSLILNRIRKERGIDWLGSFHFNCHHPEGDIFKAVMREMGWPKSCYSVYKEDAKMDADYWDYGNFETNCNAFAPISLTFWDRGQALKSTCVSGSFGGEQLYYPLARPLIKESGFAHLAYWIRWSYPSTACYSAHFKNIFSPYVDERYMSIALSIPRSRLKYCNAFGQKIDSLRAMMVTKLGSTIPVWFGHVYGLNLTEKRKIFLTESWKNSKFYKKFNHFDVINYVDPANFKWDKKDIPNKLYALATAFERVT